MIMIVSGIPVRGRDLQQIADYLFACHCALCKDCHDLSP